MNITTLALGTVSPGPVGTGGPLIVLGPLLTTFERVAPVMCTFYVIFRAYRASAEHKRNTALAQTESRTMKSAALMTLPIVFMGFLFTTFLVLTQVGLSLLDANALPRHLTRNVSDGWLLFLTVLPLAIAVVIAAASSITAAFVGRTERSADLDRLESVGDSV